MTTITILEGPKVSRPMNAIGGLYILILSSEGALTSEQIYDFCAPLAREHGYDPDGRADVGLPCVHGIKSRTYAVWFHTKEKK